MSTIRTVLLVCLGIAPASIAATLLGDSAQAACPPGGCVVRSYGHPAYVHPFTRWYYARPWIHTTSSGTPQTGKHKGTLREQTATAIKVSPHGPAGPPISNVPAGAQFSPYGTSSGSGGAQTYYRPGLQGANAASAGGGTQASGGTQGGGTQADASPGRARSTSGGSAGSNASATRPSTSSELTAVTVCKTLVGTCPMQREVGTPCQCMDTQGHVYDGRVQ